MARIHILPPHIANQIAAGEVVERPASVVKELLENAIDAGATRLRIDLEDGGKRLIRVADDGAGMDREDLDLAVEPHATSKIHTEADLAAIATLGFRGEALPSIAAVSCLTVTSRPTEAMEGWRVRVAFGQDKTLEAVGCPAGTTVEVEDLFLRIPARRHFLKGRQTELGHAAQIVRLMAVSFPEIHFELRSDGRHIFRSRPGAQGAHRLQPLLGDRLIPRLIPVEGGAAGLRILGYMAPPEEGRSSSRAFYFFLNGRPITSRLLWRATREAYRGRLMRGVHPVGVLFLEILPERVDVNVHPTKQEVRFHDPQAVYRAVYHGARRALGGTQTTLEGLLSRETIRREAASQHEMDLQPRREAVAETLPPSWGPSPEPKGLEVAKGPMPEKRPVVDPEFEGRAEGHLWAYSRGAASGLGEERAKGWSAPAHVRSERTLLAQDLRLIGQLARSYIVAEGSCGLVLIDQHAAHEAVLFARLMRQISSSVGGLVSQPLLFPEVLERSPEDLALLPGVTGALEGLGITVEAFGLAQMAVRSVPEFLAAGPRAMETVGALVDRLMAHPEQRSETLLHELVATMACHAAVRADQALEPVEMEALVAEVVSEGATHCPHGRPVAQSLDLKEIQRRFRRT